MGNSVPSNFLVQAEAMLRAWRELNPEMKFGVLSQADLDNAIDNFVSHIGLVICNRC